MRNSTKTVATPETDNVPMLVTPLLWGRIGATLVHTGALSIPCAPAADELSLLLVVVSGPVCLDVPLSQQCSDSRHPMTIPTPDGDSYRGMSKGCAVAPPLGPDKRTDEDIRTNMSVWCAPILAPAPAADADVVAASTPPKNPLSPPNGTHRIVHGRESGDGMKA